jgi:hypothetical protein
MLLTTLALGSGGRRACLCAKREPQIRSRYPCVCAQMEAAAESGALKECSSPVGSQKSGSTETLEALKELEKPADASDILDLDQAKLEIVKLRRLLGKEVRACDGSSDDRSRGPLAFYGVIMAARYIQVKQTVPKGQLKRPSSEISKGEEEEEDKWVGLNTDPAVALRRLKVLARTNLLQVCV